MRLKKQKQGRRTVRVYRTCFGFREPYKVVLDGTFIHHLSVYGIRGDAAIGNLLSARVKLFTTTCVVSELRGLGPSYSDSFSFSRSVATARCDHEKRRGAAACIMDVVGERNAEHFFIATLDSDLRRKFLEVPGVPVIFGLRNSLFLEKPSKLCLEFIKADEEKRKHMTKAEEEHVIFLSHKKKNKNSVDAAVDGDDDHHHDVRVTNKEGQILTGHDRAKFKRNKAKGPNPLSRLKKKPRIKDDSSLGHVKKKRSRRKKRSTIRHRSSTQ